MSDPEKPLNEKMLVYIILGLLGIGFLTVIFLAVSWMFHDGSPNWKQIFIDDVLIMVVVAMFVYGFYMNTKM